MNSTVELYSVLLLIVWVKRKAAERKIVCSTRTIHRWKGLGERFPSMYRAFSAELIQHQFRRITFPQHLAEKVREIL